MQVGRFRPRVIESFSSGCLYRLFKDASHPYLDIWKSYPFNNYFSDSKALFHVLHSRYLFLDFFSLSILYAFWIQAWFSLMHIPPFYYLNQATGSLHMSYNCCSWGSWILPFWSLKLLTWFGLHFHLKTENKCRRFGQKMGLWQRRRSVYEEAPTQFWAAWVGGCFRKCKLNLSHWMLPLLSMYPQISFFLYLWIFKSLIVSFIDF